MRPAFTSMGPGSHASCVALRERAAARARMSEVYSPANSGVIEPQRPHQIAASLSEIQGATIRLTNE
jgi:hypothetical protein